MFPYCLASKSSTLLPAQRLFQCGGHFSTAGRDYSLRALPKILGAMNNVVDAQCYLVQYRRIDHEQ